MYEKEMELACVAVRDAGQRIVAARGTEAHVLSSEGRDIKLQTDRDAEAIILEHLSESGHPILTEESGEHGKAGSGVYWIIDPLDGTMNYSRAIPMACVAIALFADEQPLIGVVYDFYRDELFQGNAEGAWLNDDAIHVSGRDKPDESVLATGFPSNRSFDEAALGDFVSHLRQFKKVRLFGSAALSLAYVACGRVDAYSEDDIMLWDVAAGVALVRGAGGWVSLEASERLKWGRRVRCASSPALWRDRG